MAAETVTLQDIADAQEALEADAAEALPFAFNTCSYALPMRGVRQQLFACLTCPGVPNAVCAGCSIACHADHQLVELFTRRNFTCDCGTVTMDDPIVDDLADPHHQRCEIDGRAGAPRNEGNVYDHNHAGRFCVCDGLYDPGTEDDEMVQCIQCEDWFHQACLTGTRAGDEGATLAPDDWETLVCERCATRTPLSAFLHRYAGSQHSGVVVLDTNGQPVGLLPTGAAADAPAPASEENGDTKPDVKAEDGSAATDAAPAASISEREQRSIKRKDGDDAERSSKRVKLEGDDSATLPSTSQLGEASTSASQATTAVASSQSTAIAGSSSSSASKTACMAPPPREGNAYPLTRPQRGHVFLQEGWRERWCRCSECTHLYAEVPYMLAEEEEYEPPDDPDAHRSLAELGMEALATLPRAQAIEGILAFQGMQERFREFLQPYSERNETVSERAIQDFFTGERERVAANAQRNRDTFF